MKKIYFLAAIALVAGISCTKQVPVTNNGPETPIAFSPISQRVGTKANVFGEQNATYTAQNSGAYEDFAAWSYYTAAASATTNPQTNSTASAGSEFFGTSTAGVTCVHNDAVGGVGTDFWAPASAYYWPKIGYLHFHAMSPADFGTGTLAHSWGSGISITGYVAPVYTDANATGLTDDASQIDLLYSDFVFDQRRSDFSQTGSTVGTYDDETDGKYAHDGVNLLFRHALSLVQFKVKTSDNYKATALKHEFYVRKIEILQAYNTGNFNENRKNDLSNGYTAVTDMSGKIGFTSDNADNSQTPYWTSFSNEVATIVPYDVTAGAAMTGTEATSVTSGQVGTTIIALPQPLAHAVNNVQVKVTYDYRFSADNGTNWTPLTNQTLTVDLAGAKGTYDNTGTPVANYVVNNWLINHKYIYTLSFKLDPIIFDPAVETFVEVDDITVELPFQN